MIFATQTPGLVFTNLLLIFILYSISKPAFYNKSLSNLQQNSVIFLILLFCLFSFWGKDWFGYLRYFSEIKQGYEVSTIETIYNHLGKFCPNYIIFRLIIWGSAFVLFYKTLKLLPINRNLALFFFCTIFLIWFSYARASLAMATMFYGYTKMATTNKRLSLKWIIGILILCVSFYLHKSAIIAMIAIMTTELLKGANKKIVIIGSIIVFPLLVFFLKFQFGDIVEQLLVDDGSILNDYATTGNAYLESDRLTVGPGVLIQMILERLPYYLLAIISIKALLASKCQIPNSIQQFMMVIIILIFISSIFAFELGLNTSAVYGRMMRYLQIPACVVLSYCYANNIYPRFTKYTYSIFFISTCYSLLYVLYNSYVAS